MSFGNDQHKVDLRRIPAMMLWLGDLQVALQAKCQHLFTASVAWFKILPKWTLQLLWNISSTAWICLQPESWHNLKAFVTFTIPYQHDQHRTMKKFHGRSLARFRFPHDLQCSRRCGNLWNGEPGPRKARRENATPRSTVASIGLTTSKFIRDDTQQHLNRLSRCLRGNSKGSSEPKTTRSNFNYPGETGTPNSKGEWEDSLW